MFDINSNIIFVGEAEPDSGKYGYAEPFTGALGDIFTQCLHAAGITKSTCKFIGLNIEFLCNNPSNIIVAVGERALNFLTGKNSVTKWRGSILESTILPGRKVIPVLHSGYINAIYVDRFTMISDMKRVLKQSAFPEIILPKRDLKIFPSFMEAMAYVDFLTHQPLVSVDIEVINQEVSHISFSHIPSYAMSIDFTPRYDEIEEMQLWLKIASLLENPNIIKVGQNLMFDIPFLALKNGIITKGKICDTMIAQKWTYPDFLKGLDFICSIYTEEPFYKDDGKQWKTGITDHTSFAIYSAKDAAVTLDAWYELEKEMDRAGTRITHDFTTSLYPALTYMQLRGIKAEQATLQVLKKTIEEKMVVTQEELNKVAGQTLNPNSSKQCKEYFYIKKGLKPYTDRKTHQPTTDDKAMTRIARKGYKEAKLIQDYRGLSKLKGTYLDIAFDADSRIRCSINPAGTVEGRLSTSQTIFGTGTNLQNLPKEFKQFLIADEGMLMIEVDKVQAEWIETAFLSGDANMIEVIEKNLDAHVKTAMMMFPGMSAELIIKDHELVGNSTDEDFIKKVREDNIPEIFQFNPIKTMSCRQIAKKCNHGLNYDLGYKGFALSSDIEESVSKTMHGKYHNGYPGVHQWHRWVRDQLQRDRTLTNFFGRKRKFLDRWGDALFKSAYAQLPASTVADLLNRGIKNIYDMQGGVMRYVDMLIQVHDSLLFQYPVDRLADLPTVLRIIFYEMEPVITYGGRSHVIPTDMKIGFDWKHMDSVKFTEDDEDMFWNLSKVINKLRPDNKISTEINITELIEEANENEGENIQEINSEVLIEG